MKILLADDDPQILRALRITLAAYGYEVIPAADGAAAVRLAVERHPDLLLLDLGMPKLDGIEVISAVRGWSSMPILVLSGRSDATDKVAALDAGADDYITKPFSTEELLARIRALSRRTPSAAGTTSTAGPAVIRFGQVSVDMAAKVVTRGPDQRVLRLTPTNGRCWRCCSMPLASLSPNNSYLNRCGDRIYSRRPGICVFMWGNCVRSLSRFLQRHGISSPSLAWGTGLFPMKDPRG